MERIKNIMKNKSISLFLLVLLSLTVISCGHDVIFYDIAREVKLVNPEINGNCYSLVPLNGKLYVQNGNLWEKSSISATHGWTQITRPGDSNIIRVASDASCLYVMNEDFDVWAKPVSSSTWTKVASDVTELFDNQVAAADCTTAGREAFITVNSSTVKQLAGTGTPQTIDATDIVGNGSYIKAAVWDGTQTVFSSNDAICTLTTPTDTILYTITTVANASHDRYTICYKKATDSGWTEGGKVSNPANCICQHNAKLLVGTAQGYEVCTISSSSFAPQNGTSSSTNAESAFGRSRQVIMLKSFAGIVYAGVTAETSSNYSKLWSLVGSTWNYE